MHVCHVINNLEVGGAETMLLKLVDSSRTHGIESSVISLMNKGVIGPQIEQLGVRVDSLGVNLRRPKVSAIFRLASLLRQRQPDVVVTWLYQADLVGGLVSKFVSPRTPVVWNLRNTLLDAQNCGRTTWFVQQICVKLSRLVPTAILCNSRAVQDVHAELGFEHSKLCVIPNGFDLERFSPSVQHRREVRRELGIPEYTRLIGMMAQFHPRKDHSAFLRSALILCERWENVDFVLCGTGVTSANDAIASLLGESPHKHRFHLLGPRSDMPRLQASLDIGVLASAPYREGFPNAVGEAMACGVPCVVTSPGGSPEVVGDCGRVVPSGDAEALAASCSDLLELPPHELSQLGRLARLRMEGEFSLAKVTEQYIKLWRQLLKQPCGLEAKSERLAA